MSFSVNSVPSCAVEVTSMEPPCAVTTSRAMESPKPMLVVFGSSSRPGSRTMGSKILLNAFSGIRSPSLWMLRVGRFELRDHLMAHGCEIHALGCRGHPHLGNTRGDLLERAGGSWRPPSVSVVQALLGFP